MKNKNKTIREQFLELFKEDDVFWNNEIRANIFVCIQLYILCGILILSFILNEVGVFDVSRAQMLMVIAINIPVTLLAAIITNVFKGQKHWIKYMLCMVSVFLSVGLCSSLSFFVTLFVAIPVILSVRYYSQRLTVTISVASFVGMIVSELMNGMYGGLNLNFVSIRGIIDASEGIAVGVEKHGYNFERYILDLYRGSFLPKALLFIIIALTCIELSKRAREMVIEQDKVSKKTEGINKELSMANRIQEGVLPRTFPPYPDRKDFDIIASMDPAKEVGGDFYDFYLLDEDHLMLVMADVSGKGIPAALFMMISKMIIKTLANTNISVKKIAESVNNQICADNPVEMFVTAWIGIVEISTGKVNYVDAGHEYPAVFRKETGRYEFEKGNKNFFLGGMEGISYKESVMQLNKGDILFLYTDGVPEATNSDKELFGMERMLDALNAATVSSLEEILQNIRSKVDEFVEDAPQFDDLTMLAFRLN